MDAKPYSISGQEIDKASYAQTRFSLVAGGMLRIPKIVKDDKTNFFVMYSGSRSRNPYDAASTLPSALERGGDFSQSVNGTPVTIYDPSTNRPFPGNVIPASRIDSASKRPAVADAAAEPARQGAELPDHQLRTAELETASACA